MLLFGEHFFNSRVPDMRLFSCLLGGSSITLGRFRLNVCSGPLPLLRLFRQRLPDLERNPDALVTGDKLEKGGSRHKAGGKIVDLGPSWCTIFAWMSPKSGKGLWWSTSVSA